MAIPPKEFCARCGARAWQTVALSGDGTLASYTLNRMPGRYRGMSAHEELFGADGAREQPRQAADGQRSVELTSMTQERRVLASERRARHTDPCVHREVDAGHIGKVNITIPADA